MQDVKYHCPKLLEYLKEKGIPQDTPVISHATVEDVAGKYVIGILPLSLACHAGYVTEVQMNVPAELRGQELTYEQVVEYAGEMITYKVEKAVAPFLKNNN